MKNTTLTGALLALALGGIGAIPAARPKAKATVRTPADILRRKARQAAKLARRAARAKKAGQ